MRIRVGKLLIGFVAIAVFIGLAETNTEYANKQLEEAKETKAEQKL
ncbi:hypothetical protein JOC85_001778 [Bacillus mesophilus]|uniref:Uncharacterized protein n=1 Tax=Bacillus mesophilus TaxID=1808955 RepID=A0A6M0Q5C2_9BACI|nr:hypothetical protein [Bacillus mesophilus]MBM7661006.1 hypothetical protein [Bacillus mesophilus]NEY71454.1 hypothetical protein [Bacillus mesophilus]